MAERLLCKERVRSSSLLVSTNPCGGCPTTEELGTTRDDSRPTWPVRTGRHRAPDPCPAARRQATDQRIAGDDRFTSIVGGPPRWAAPLQLECFGRLNESSISPSQRNKIPIPLQRLAAWSEAGGGQATKGTRWMPWRQEPMKDVAGCEKLREVASRR